jgi:hypothetical protein
MPRLDASFSLGVALFKPVLVEAREGVGGGSDRVKVFKKQTNEVWGYVKPSRAVTRTRNMDFAKVSRRWGWRRIVPKRKSLQIEGRNKIER